MHEPFDAWDAGLNRLVEDDMARRVGDIRTSLVAEISRALLDSHALGTADPDQLAEIAVDVLIEFSRKTQSGGRYPAGGSGLAER